MSRLEFYSRPLVAFDPTNKQHRKYFYDFLKYNSWGRCPVRFICPDDHSFDLPTMIKNMLIEHYVSKEFGRSKDIDSPRPNPVAKKPQKKK